MMTIVLLSHPLQGVKDSGSKIVSMVLDSLQLQCFFITNNAEHPFCYNQVQPLATTLF